MLLHDAVGHGETETCAVSDALCRKERIKNLAEIFLRNSLAGVGDLDDDIAVQTGRMSIA